jgi:ferredoxin
MSELMIDKNKCAGCGTCVAVCPEGAAYDDDGKAKVINSDKLKACGGVSICPSQAIQDTNKV